MKNTGFIFLVLGIVICSCTSKSSNTESNNQLRKEIHSELEESSLQPLFTISEEQLIDSLEHLGFFNLIPSDDIDQTKKALKEYFTILQFFDVDDENNYRFYFLDGESLFELGGMAEYLHTVKPTFEQLGLILTFSNDSIVYDSKESNHTIDINGTTYTAYQGDFNINSWGIAAYNFAKILNTELEKQGSKERVYLISGGNDGRMVFLTEKMYDFVRRVYPQDEDCPLEVEEWAKVNGL